MRLRIRRGDARYVAAKALQRAQKPCHSPEGDMPDFLRADKLITISIAKSEFPSESALWAAEQCRFAWSFFIPGYLYQVLLPSRFTERIHAKHVRRSVSVQELVKLSRAEFPKQIPAAPGYAGFRILVPLNQQENADDLARLLARVISVARKGKTVTGKYAPELELWDAEMKGRTGANARLSRCGWQP